MMKTKQKPGIFDLVILFLKEYSKNIILNTENVFHKEVLHHGVIWNIDPHEQHVYGAITKEDTSGKVSLAPH